MFYVFIFVNYNKFILHDFGWKSIHLSVELSYFAIDYRLHLYDKYV